MANSNRYRAVINGKVYESTNNVLGTYVRKYESFAPEFGKKVCLGGNESKVGDLGKVAIKNGAKSNSMER